MSSFLPQSTLPLFALLLGAAAPPEPLAPVKPWNVEAQEDMCLLSREYGKGADSVVIGFQPLFGNRGMDVIILSNRHTGEAMIGDGEIERSPDGEKFKGPYVTQGIPKSSRSFTRISVERDLFDDLGTAASLRIKAGSVRTVVRIAAFAKAKPVFEKCEADLLRSWDVDPASLAEERSAKPIGNLQRIFQRKGYPPEAFANGYIGKVTAVLNIDATGKATKCRVVIGGGKILNDNTCARALLLPFTPGTDPGGKAAPSIYVLRVKWEIGS